ncbi:MAG: biosynthetic arginine decarboxylase [Planctomycetes bacterium]|nr:biosynthetic arginine decarboxylase [Planctomycetota bacterium]
MITTSKKQLRPWTVNESADLYAVNGWGKDLFSISPEGTVWAHPKPGTRICLRELVSDLARRGIESPLLLRFPDVLAARIQAINAAFAHAIEECEYQGQYRGVYPIKVNQDRRVVRKIVEAGRPYHYGLEAGSKPELLAVMAMLEDPEALVICNGYKDEFYVETALLASRLGLNVILVVEKPGELELIARVAERIKIQPTIGVRVKLSARGAGRWEQSGGDRSKFGLSARELLDAVEFLRERDLLDRFQLLHFHLGSQISSIRSVKNALREAGRFYVELVGLGAGMRYCDVGGGLAIDYDGSQTNFHSSANYSLQEYANDVVFAMGEICAEAEIPPPTLVTEAGRAITAHHAVLAVDVLGVNQLATPSPRSCPEDAAPVVVKLWECLDELTTKNLMETYHDGLDFKEEALQLFKLGHLSLAQRVHAENIFWALCARIRDLARGMDPMPDDLSGLEQAMADTYFCNFSLFQSLPDSWAVKQLFPVMPLQRLDEEPTRRAVLADITCDSDGGIKQFVDVRDVKDVLEVHELNPGEPYHLGIFLVGAYQEILGDLHNLFGDTNEVHVEGSPDGGYSIKHVIPGESVEDVLRYVGYERHRLIAWVRRACEKACSEGRMSLEESKNLIRSYQQGLSAYTYLEQDDAG